MNFGFAEVAAITVIAYVAGLTAKAWGLKCQWVQIVRALAGAALGVVCLYVMPDFPANNAVSAAAVGIVSGLAATGTEQMVGKEAQKDA